MQNIKSKLIQGINSPVPEHGDPNVVVVRGRTKDSSKPTSFNKLWTEEEQQR